MLAPENIEDASVRSDELMPINLCVNEAKNRMQLQKLGPNERHAGLFASMLSSERKRSAKNAYVLLYGLSGAGKSSTINQMFGDQDVSDVGDEESTTSDILEFAVPVELPEIGVTGSELRVIDMPGLGDTKGLDYDARTLATLKTFLSNHKELNNRLPNVVLVIAAFNDKRYKGESSAFVKMLKAFNLFRKELVDMKSPNVIFVLTHCCSETKKIQQNPQQKLDTISALIERFCKIPKPPILVVAENQPAEFDLNREENGYYRLPNGDYYPYNLYEVFQDITGRANDQLGMWIFRNAFKDPKSLQNTLRSSEKLVEDSNCLVSKFIMHLTEVNFNIKQTDVNKRLSNAWDKLKIDIKESYFDSLSLIQQRMQNMNICTLQDVPTTLEARVRLAKELPLNPVSVQLLESLKVEIPKLSISLVVGHGYSVLEDRDLAISPFDLSDLSLSPIGFLIPSALKCETCNHTEQFCRSYKTDEDYKLKRQRDLKVECKNILKLNWKVRAGYSKEEPGPKNHTNSISISKEHRLFRLTLITDPPPTAQFRAAVKQLPSFDKDNSESNQKWDNFFKIYGTHIVQSAYGGGMVELKVKHKQAQGQMATAEQMFRGKNIDSSKRTANNNSVLLECQLQDSILNLFDFQGSIECANQEMANHTFIDCDHKVFYHGGDATFHGSFSADEATIKKWRESLPFHPEMLTMQPTLIPISYYVRKFNFEKAQHIDLALENILGEPVRAPVTQEPPSRKDIPEPPKKGSSCLKQGTRILMADGTHKAVQNIKIGDKVMDAHLKPVTVVGCGNFFLRNRHFYGFSEAAGCFFTDAHLFVSASRNELLTVSTDALFEENPLMKDYIVKPMRGQFEVLQWRQNAVEVARCNLVKDETVYPPETPVYFLEVDSRSGTYFANGYVCRHELPDFDKYPLTFACLAKVLTLPIVKTLNNGDLTLTDMTVLCSVAKRIANEWQNLLQSYSAEEAAQTVPRLAAGENNKAFDLTEKAPLAILHSILASSRLCAFAYYLYYTCSALLARHLDNADQSLPLGVILPKLMQTAENIFSSCSLLC